MIHKLKNFVWRMMKKNTEGRKSRKKTTKEERECARRILVKINKK